MDALEPDLPLQGNGCEEILVHARNHNGFREAFLLNLCDRALSPEVEVPGEFVLYDPVQEYGIRCKDRLPVGFSLPQAGSCMILPPDFQCRIVPFVTAEAAPLRADIGRSALKNVS